MLSTDHKPRLLELARRYGFSFTGIARAAALDPEARHLEAWLNRGYHAGMSWLERNLELRVDPQKLVPGAKTVICFMQNYAREELPHEEVKISRYAWGRDYHKVLRGKLKHMMQDIRAEIGDIQGRLFVDSGPVMEKAWSQRAGLGWVGKHTNLIRKGEGSWYFLAVLISDLDLDADEPVTDHCGSCTKCIDACPTDAIVAPYQLDAGKCISYLTIELKDAVIPDEHRSGMENWAFGCDICQEVCPWNRFAKASDEPDFGERPGARLGLDEWKSMTEERFEELFAGTPLMRTGYQGMMRNISAIDRTD